MRIAQVAPLAERVPPAGYGGTERIVHYLTEELVSRGHEVTLFASADSETSARLVPCAPRALRLMEECRLPDIYHLLMIERIFSEEERFDLIHFHVDALHFPLARRSATAHVTTLHGRLDLPELVPLYETFDDIPVVSISDHQRGPLPHARWEETIYHGMPTDLFEYGEGAGGYLAFLGRISPEKRVDRAIEIARRTGERLRIAAKVDPVDRAYFQRQIEPLLDQPHVDFIGEIGAREKNEFLAGAKALLFPIDWPEPFGLVMIESFACGTPVIAFRCGSVPEVMQEGVSGFVVETVGEAVEAVGRLHEVSRRGCRDHFERRFLVERMTDDYLRLYRRLRHAASHLPATSNFR